MGGSTAKAMGEFSRIFAVERLGDRKVIEQIEATVPEMSLVARRLGLLSLSRLSAECSVGRGLGGLVKVECHWAADLEQACVVTLAPVRQSLTGDFQASYQALAGERSAEDEVLVDPMADDPPEPLPLEGIDLGELVVQELAVSLDPYPRVEGAEVPGRFQPSENDSENHPFAALKVLKNKQ